MDEIRTIVTQYGDVFDPDETREMLRDANVRGDGNVFYEDFIESMFSLATELNDIEVSFHCRWSIGTKVNICALKVFARLLGRALFCIR